MLTSSNVIRPFMRKVRHQSSSFHVLDAQQQQQELVPFVSLSVMIHGVSQACFPVHFLDMVNNVNADKYIYQLLNQKCDDFCLGWNSSTTADTSSPSLIPSSFAVLKLLKSDIKSEKHRRRIQCVQGEFRSSSVIQQMKSVYVVSSPFGILSPDCFSNSVSKGIVSNVICDSKYQCLAFLTDARMLPGSEGGGVFYKSDSSCIGICTIPIRSKSSNIDFNLVITLNAIYRDVDNVIRLDVAKTSNEKVLKNVPIVEPLQCFASNSPFESLSPSMDNAKKSVVLINIANSWSSGIVISQQGFILTNAHLFAPFLNSDKIALKTDVSITVQFDEDTSNLNRNNRFYPASLKFTNKTGPFDVAVIQLNDTSVRPKHFVSLNAMQPMKQGQTVYGIGYPLYHPMTVGTSIRTSTITKGVLSKIVRHNTVPVLLQSSVLIHNGNSGGGIFDSSGALIGLVTSNARHVTDRLSGTSRLIPSLNFALPTIRLEPLSAYILNPTPSSLHTLNQVMNQPNEELSSMWALKKSSRIQPMTPNIRSLRKPITTITRSRERIASQPEDAPHINSKL